MVTMFGDVTDLQQGNRFEILQHIKNSSGEVLSTPSPPLYHGGDMTKRVRVRVKKLSS